MFKKSFFAACVAIVTMGGAFTASAQTAAQMDRMPAEILKCVNEYRAQKGLGPMTMEPIICKGAESHSRDMATHKVPFGHDGFDERMADITSKVKPANGWAENVAAGSLNSREVVDMWLNSPHHKKNIEGDYNTCGIGICRGTDGSLYFTHIFVNKK